MCRADAIHNGAYIFDYAYTWLSPLGSEDTAARKGAAQVAKTVVIAG